MNIYEHSTYKNFLRAWIAQQPKGGRGMLRLWAAKLGVHPTLLSQVMQDKKELGLEMAEDLAKVLNLTEAEADFFLLLVLHERAGSVALKKRLNRQIQAEQARAKNLGSRLKVRYELEETAKGIFYSSWLYSGVRNLAAIKTYNTSEAIAEKLRLPRETIQAVVEFLLETGLCVNKDGKLSAGPNRTHVKADSPHVTKHHQNWRLRGMDKMVGRSEQDLFFTFPMSLSKSDANKIRELLPSWIEKIHAVVGGSQSETARCLSIDFFEY